MKLHANLQEKQKQNKQKNVSRFKYCENTTEGESSVVLSSEGCPGVVGIWAAPWSGDKV